MVLQESDINLLHESFPHLESQIQQLIALSSVDSDRPNVVVYGVFNAGKSSLLNCITDNLEKEYFKTRDVRETIEKKILLHNGVNYIDTPGLDMYKADDDIANNAGHQADILLFVHKLVIGPIQKNDLKRLKEIAKKHSDSKYIISVITAGENAIESKSLIEDIKNQLRSVVPNIKVFVVSNNSYIRGVLENKKALTKHSGIPDLKTYIEETVNQLNADLANVRTQRKRSVKESILIEIKEHLSKLTTKLEAINHIEDMRQHNFVKTVQLLQKDAEKSISV